jgi:flavodoxin
MIEKYDKKRLLVVYYSYEGNTRFIAEGIAKELGADIQELKPIKDIKSRGFSKYMWGGRQVVTKKRPELQPLERKPENYEVIFIGTPVWAFTFAPALRTFFSEHPLKAKKVALFMCHGGGPKEAMAKMESELQGNIIIGKLDLPHVLEKEAELKKKRAIDWAKKCLDS